MSEKCPCCDRTVIEQIKDMHDMCDEYAGRIFERQQARPREMFTWPDENYTDAVKFERWQAQADILKWAVDLLEGRGGCL